MSDDDLREIVRAAAEEALSQTLEVNGGELESVTTIYRPSGLAVFVADAVLAALPRYERIPTMALSLTDEWIEGVPFSVHRKVGDPFCGDESICAQHEPVYRRLPTEGAQP